METNPPLHVHDGTHAAPTDATHTTAFVVPVVHEEMHVGVRQVDTGRGVRLHKTVSEQTHQIDQTLMRDAISVKRVPIDKIVPLSEAPVARQEGNTWIVPILEEILIVEKRLRIKEEVHIVRTAQAEPYADTVVLRSEQVTIERFDDTAKTRAEPQVHPSNGGNHHATHTRSGI